MNQKSIALTLAGSIYFTLNGCGKTTDNITASSAGSESASNDSVMYGIDSTSIKDIYECATEKAASHRLYVRKRRLIAFFGNKAECMLKILRRKNLKKTLLKDLP